MGYTQEEIDRFLAAGADLGDIAPELTGPQIPPLAGERFTEFLVGLEAALANVVESIRGELCGQGYDQFCWHPEPETVEQLDTAALKADIVQELRAEMLSALAEQIKTDGEAAKASVANLRAVDEASGYGREPDGR